VRCFIVGVIVIIIRINIPYDIHDFSFSSSFKTIFGELVFSVLAACAIDTLEMRKNEKA
jgi:hypothetical protein